MITAEQFQAKKDFILAKVAIAFGVSLVDSRVKDLAWDLDILLDQFEEIALEAGKQQTLTDLSEELQKRLQPRLESTSNAIAVLQELRLK